MKSLFLSLFLCATACIVNAQNLNWSVEANYPISVGDDLGNDNPGIVDIGLKYRFLDLGFGSLGAGINAGVFHDNHRTFAIPETFDFDETNWLIQPKVFMEFRIPGLQKLTPFVGAGYTIIESRFDGDFPGVGEDETQSSTDGGLNINLGVAYDITSRIFVQVQYDYIRNSVDLGELPDIKQDLGYLKLGVGFRF